MLAGDAEREQKLRGGEPGGTGAGEGHPHVADVLADQLQRVAQRRAGDDRRAVLVVVHHRDVEPALALRLDVEALRRADVLEVDAAERRREGDDDVDEPSRVLLVDLEVERVEVREALEQDRLALHDRLRRRRTDAAEPEHGGPVADHSDEMAHAGVGVGRVGVVADGQRRLGDAG